MRAGVIGSIGLGTVLWATAPAAQTVAQSFPTTLDPQWTADLPLAEAQAWSEAQGRRVARGWSGVQRRVATVVADIRPEDNAVQTTLVDSRWAADAGFTSAAPVRVERTDLWRNAPDGGRETFRLTTTGALRRADGAPVPPTPLDATMTEPEAYDVAYSYAWPAARATTASGWQVDLTPHAGVGYGTYGGSAQAGATVRLGRDLEEMVPEGRAAFGDRGRWYLFAAGSGRAVGYNFARDRDGAFQRSGMSHDSGAFLGDATVGVAWRRGATQASFGVSYREIEPEGLRRIQDLEEVEEGVVALQLSIKPDW